MNVVVVGIIKLNYSTLFVFIFWLTLRSEMENDKNRKEVLPQEDERHKRLALVELFEEYSENSTLHGFGYLNKRGLTVIEKIFWFFTILISVVLCCYLIRNVWTKWSTSPVIITISEQMVPAWMVPFPSVTICPEIKCKKTAYDYTQNFEKYKKNFWLPDANETETTAAQKYQDVALVCDILSLSSNPAYFLFLRNVSTGVEIINNILEVSPTAKDVFVDCKWRGETFSCKKWFNTVLTSKGVCLTFNGLAESEIFNKKSIQTDYKYMDTNKSSKGWSNDGGYDIDDDFPYPMRGNENGPSPDLEIILRESIRDIDEMCNSLNHGFKIYLQHPMDMVTDSLFYFSAHTNKTTALAVTYKMTTTADSLKTYAPELRQCYFQSDRQLRYFHTYTQTNCRIECSSNYTAEVCGCVWFNMPFNDSRQVCNFRQRDCIRKAKEKLAMREMKAALSVPSKSEVCNCLPACNSITYDAESSKTDFNYNKWLSFLDKTYHMDIEDELQNSQTSKLEIYFKEPWFVSMRRSELFGLTDFLANCGGLLGLFLGFSFLSLVEIIYFMTLRFFCVLRGNTVVV